MKSVHTRFTHRVVNEKICKHNFGSSAREKDFRLDFRATSAFREKILSGSGHAYNETSDHEEFSSAFSIGGLHFLFDENYSSGSFGFMLSSIKHRLETF